MKSKFILLLPLLTLASSSFAQVSADSVDVTDHDGMTAFTFSESQLDDDQDATQSATSLTSYNDDPYMSNVGYLFSPMRFRVRGYDSQYNGVYFNGARMNDVETGRFSYGLIGGLNDVTRNQQGIMTYEQNNVGYMDLGGGSNINMRASQYGIGSKAVVSLTNRNYKVRAMFTHATGMMKNGWSFVGSAGIRYSDEGVIEGTFYHSGSIFLGAEKYINDKHSISLAAMMAPTERASQAAATEETYWLANSHYYNSNWGYQGGKKRNARVTKTLEPTGVLTWDFKIDDKTKLTTTAVFKYSRYGTTAFNWGSNAADPRPDYYKNLPSNAYNVWELVPEDWQLTTWQNLYDYWKADKANRQINWDKLYAINAEAMARGKDAVYLLEERHNDQLSWNLNSEFNKVFNKNHRLDVGVWFNHSKGMHYKTVNDLLGADFYTDIDKFSVSDYGIYSKEAQNDLDNPNRIVYKGDKFGYNYNIFVNKAQIWAGHTYQYDNLSVITSGNIGGTTIEREGLMRNGRSPEHSKGSSGTAKFLTGGGKVSVGYTVNAHHIFTLSTGLDARAPLSNYSFVAARIKNDFVANLTTEKIFHSELAYKFDFGALHGKLSGYYSRFKDGVEQSAFYDDQESRFTYLTMTGVEKEHYGAELSLIYRVNSALSFTFIGSMGEAKYTSNPDAVLTYENATEVMTHDNVHNLPLKVIADGMRLNGTPLTALSLGVDYNIKGWYLSLNGNYYARSFCDFSEYRRLTKSMEAYLPSYNEKGQLVYGVTKDFLKKNGGLLLDGDGNLVKAYAAEQEEFDGGFMLDASIGRSIRLRRGKSLSINLSLQNILNNTNLRTGGYEQNRDDNYSTGEQRPYVFSKNAKYYYANPFNLFLNVGFRF